MDKRGSLASEQIQMRFINTRSRERRLLSTRKMPIEVVKDTIKGK